MVAILVRSGVDLQAARRRKLKFDLPAAAATADEEETQTRKLDYWPPTSDAKGATSTASCRSATERSTATYGGVQPDTKPPFIILAFSQSLTFTFQT